LQSATHHVQKPAAQLANIMRTYRDAMRSSPLSALRVTVMVVALVPESGLPQESVACNSAKAQVLKGKPFSEELRKQAQRITGAREARAVGPDMISTSDRRPNRLNVEVDRFGIVTNFWCE
jgi:hypothetical protein